MRKHLYITICLALAAITANAQTFTDRLRQHEDGKGTVTIMQSAEIEDLVNNAQLTPQPQHPAQQQHSATQNHPDTPNTQTAPNTPHNTPENTPQEQPQTGHKNETTQPAVPAPPVNTDTEETTVDTRKKVMRNSYKTKGYRIQVFSGGNSRNDRKKAETAGAVMKSNFPNEPVYVHFYSPSWKCRMGNYKTAEEARAVLAQVKKLGYKGACIVKGTISVQY